MSFVIYAFEREYIEGVVADVLASRGRLSEGARDALNAAIANSVKLDGFRDASRAAPELLQEWVMDELIEGNDRIAAAMFRAWVDAREPLRQRVAERLSSLGVSVDGPDLRDRTFTGMWDLEEWFREAETMTEDDPGLDKDDAGLMLCYVSGMAVEAVEGEIIIESETLSSFLDQLRELPADAPEWREINGFAESALDIAAAKSTERALESLKAFLEVLAAIRENFEAELGYLEIDMDPERRTLETAESATLMPHAMGLMEELRQRLEEYSAVFPRAESRTEESQRAAQRGRCEEAVLDVMARWDGYAAEKLDLEDEPGADGLPVEDPATEDESAKAVPSEEYEALRSEADGLRREAASLKAENERLTRANSDLQADKESLGEVNGKLRTELSQSQEMEETWRRAYVSERAAVADEDEASASPTTVKEAIALAERSFPDRLVFALNSKSDRRSPFQKPDEVFDALAWLATVYFQRRTKPGKLPGFDKLLKESCPGWSYKPKQTDVTKEQFEEWYTTTIDGRRYDLDAHMGKGTSYDPQYTLRIAFAWDDEIRRVVVGYIGLHQRTRRS